MQRGDAEAERVGVGAGGQREAVGGIGQQQRQRPGQQRVDRGLRARPAVAERGVCRRAVEEHHRRRLVRPPALERVEARHRLAGIGVAGQPVHGVGREHRHSAVAYAAVEGLDVLRRHRATTTRGMPAMSSRASTVA